MHTTPNNLAKASLPNIPLWLYFFLFAHLILWTLIPVLIRHNLPLDSIEGSIWGHQLEWGYDKNPFLNGWLTALAGHFSGSSGWVIYFFSQLSVVICLWSVWRLAKEMLPISYALIAVLLLESIQYYNFHAIDFNDNNLELSLWALSIYFFYKALRSPSHVTWILTGLFLGLGMMAKYYTAVLITPMILFFFINGEPRQQLKTIAPYLGILTFLIVVLPHTIWLFFHDFITIQYVFERASSPPRWTNHLFFPLQFAWQQGEAFLPALILFTLLFIGKKTTTRSFKIARFDHTFLVYIGMGPFLITVLLSLLLGIKLRAGWGMPLLSLWGIILLALFQPTLTKTKIISFTGGIFILMGVLLSGYSYSLIYSSSTSSANFPGQEIALAITNQWHKKYTTPLAYVAGSRFVNGNVEFYSTDHPAVFIEWDTDHAPWINVQDLQKKGGVFVWNISENETLPSSIQKKFQRLEKPLLLTFAWKHNKHHLPPIQIGMAILPPN